MMKHLYILLLLIPCLAFGQVDTTTNSTPPAGTNPATPSWRFGVYGGKTYPYMLVGGKWQQSVTQQQLNAAIAGATLQKVVNADDYTDTFAGFSGDGFNHGSAIWQILSKYNFADVEIKFSSKTYMPLSSNTINFQLNNVTFSGAGRPYFADGMQKLTGGTILQGPFKLIQGSTTTSNNITLQNLGIDAGKTVTDTYYGGQATEGFQASYLYTAGQVNPWGVNFKEKDLIILCRDQTSAVHANLVERFKYVTIDNVITGFGYHGNTFKSQFMNIGSVASYATGGESVIIKSGEASNFTGKINISSILTGGMPPGITNSWVTINKALYGLMLDVQVDMEKIAIGRAQIDNATFGVWIAPVNASTLKDVSLGTLLVSNCNVGLVRVGDGKISSVYVNDLNIRNISGLNLDIEGGTGIDQDFKINTLTTLHDDAVISASGIFMTNSTSLEVGSFNCDNSFAMLNVTNNSKLILNNYIKGPNVTVFLQAGSLPPISSNLTYNSVGDVVVPNFLTANYFFTNATTEIAGMSSFAGFSNNDNAIRKYSQDAARVAIGFNPSSNPGNSVDVRTDSSGFINANAYSTQLGIESGLIDGLVATLQTDGGRKFLRRLDAASVKTFLGITNNGKDIYGNEIGQNKIVTANKWDIIRTPNGSWRWSHPDDDGQPLNDLAILTFDINGNLLTATRDSDSLNILTYNPVP